MSNPETGKSVRPGVMKRIFISYRRVDFFEATRLAAALRSEYGQDNIFLDYKSMRGGDDWPKTIRKEINQSSVLIVIIGIKWLFMQDEDSGRRRIDMKGDWVRNELITFLKRCKTNRELIVLPILINGASMPKPEHLDIEIRGLCKFNAIELQNTMTFGDFDQLKLRLEEAHIYIAPPEPSITPVAQTPPEPLTDKEEEIFLKKYKLWSVRVREKPRRNGEIIRELYRRYEFNSYQDAWLFMSQIDKRAIRELNHHPRWQNTYNRVEVWLCTFNIGHKPSKRDLKLAEVFENVWTEFTRTTR